MNTGQTVAIIVLVVLVAAVVAGVLLFRKRSSAHRRLQAAQHRREAEIRAANAERLEVEAAERAERARQEEARAQEQAAQARAEREAAEARLAQANRIDPDLQPDGRRVTGRDAAEEHERTRDGDHDGTVDPAGRTDRLRADHTHTDEDRHPAGAPHRADGREAGAHAASPAPGAPTSSDADHAGSGSGQNPVRTLADRIMGRTR